MGTYYVNAVLNGLKGIDPCKGRKGVKSLKFTSKEIAFLTVIANRQPNPKQDDKKRTCCYGDPTTLSAQMHISRPAFFKTRNLLVALDLIEWHEREGNYTNVYRIRLDTIRRLNPDLSDMEWQMQTLHVTEPYPSERLRDELCITARFGAESAETPPEGSMSPSDRVTSDKNWPVALSHIARACQTTLDAQQAQYLRNCMATMTGSAFQRYIEDFYTTSLGKHWNLTMTPDKRVGRFLAMLNRPMPAQNGAKAPAVRTAPCPPKSEWPDLIAWLGIDGLPPERINRLIARYNALLGHADEETLNAFYDRFTKRHVRDFQAGKVERNFRHLIYEHTDPSERCDLLEREFALAEEIARR